LSINRNNALSLRKQSIRTLTPGDLRIVQGGNGTSGVGAVGRSLCTSGPHRG
jgi:hypothetical protein